MPLYRLDPLIPQYLPVTDLVGKHSSPQTRLDPFRRIAYLQTVMAGGEAFSRVQVDAELTDVGWNLTDGRSVHFEYTLDDGTTADYILASSPSRARPLRQWCRALQVG